VKKTLGPALSSLIAQDIPRLGPKVLEELGQVFIFREGGWYLAEACHDPDVYKFPRTTAKRAILRLSEGQAVWDRVNHRIWIPVCTGDRREPLGFISLAGVQRTVSPDEDSRWLPVLTSLVVNLFQRLKRQEMSASTGAVPGYVHLWLASLKRGEESHPPPLVLYVVSKNMEKVQENILSGDVEYLGGTYHKGWHEGWWAVYGDRAMCPACFERLGRAGAKGAFFFDASRLLRGEGAIVDEFSRLKEASRILKLGMLSSWALDALEKKAGIRDIKAFKRFSRNASRLLKDNALVVGLFGKRDGTFLFGEDVGPFFHGEGVTFFIKKKGLEVSSDKGFQERSLSWTNSWVDRWDGPVSVTFRSISFGTKIGLAPCLFWTAVHGLFLNEKTFFKTDSVTFQLAGDEVFSLGDIKAAIFYYRAAIRINADNIGALNSLGVCHARLGRPFYAEKTFLEAVEKDPLDCMGYYNLGEIFLRKGRIKEARRILQKAYRLCPEKPPTGLKLLEALLEDGAFEEAKGVLEDLKSRLGENPNMIRAERVFARAEFLIGDMEGASQRARRLLSSRPGDQEALFIVAACLYKLEKEKEAALRLMKSIEPGIFPSMRMQDLFKGLLKGMEGQGINGLLAQGKDNQ